MAKFGMRRSLWLVSFLIIGVLVAGCSKPSPTAPSGSVGDAGVLGDAGPLILPYTGGPTTTISGRGGKQEEVFEGRVEGFPATPGAFVVDGRTVLATSQTSFQIGNREGSFADLAIGQRV